MRPQLVVGNIVRQAASARPDGFAAGLADETTTFGELDRDADEIARRLLVRGAGGGHRVVVWAATDLSLTAIFVGAARAGSVFVPVNPAATEDEASAVIAAARPTVVVADESRLPIATTIAGALGATAVGLEALTSGPSQAFTEPSVRGTDPHVVFFTSGTSGDPKGAILSHEVNVLRSHPGALAEPRGAAVCMFPLFHMAAWTIALQQWQARAGVVFVRSAEAVPLCEAVARHGATHINCIPAVWRRILHHVGAGPCAELATVRFADTGTSVTPPELLRAIKDVLPGARTRVFYGSTEAGNVACLEDADIERKPGRVGLPSLFVDVRLDEASVLWVRSPLLFDGYFGDTTATSAAIVDGWYRTGDLAESDDEGYLSIVGRADDVIRTGGETVAPSEVERVVLSHPAITEAGVVGIDDPEWGQIVGAVVVARDGTGPTLEDLRSFCRGRLAPHKTPRRLAVVDELPRTQSTQQLQRPRLVELLGREPPPGGGTS
jgi:acyl-CoA synthetase (AMP-forming)/AMP-acid ligase II